MNNYTELLNNSILLLALGLIYDTLGIYKIQRKSLREILSGILVGLLGMAVMLTPWMLAPGIFFDTRWVLISLSGLFFGLVPTLIASLMTISLRLFQGGAGMYVGSLVIIVAAIIGLTWRRLERKRCWKLGWLNLYFLGLLVQCAVLSCMYFMPPEVRLKIVIALAPPLLTIFPVGTMILGMVLRRQRDRRATELALIENRKLLDRERGLLRGLIDSIPDVISFKDTQGKYLGCNRAFEETVQVTEQNLTGKTDQELFGRTMADQFSHQDQHVIATGIPYSGDEWLQFPDGTKHRMDAQTTQFRGLDGTLYGSATIRRDVTERWLAERELNQRQKEWEATFNSIEDIITIQDPSMRIIKANKAAFDTFPDAKVIGEPCYQLFRQLSSVCPDCPLEPGGIHDERDKIVVHENLGKTFQITATHVNFPDREGDYLIHIAKDVTKQQELEGQLRQKFKMEAVGVLAGGMAHNFNNNLAIVMGNVELAMRKSKDSNAVNRYLDIAKTGLLRSRDLIKQILLFARQEPPEMRLVRPDQVVEETLQLLQSTIPSSVELHYQTSPEAREISINGDSTRLQEALINLCSNAVFAMGEKGVIDILLDAIDLPQGELPSQGQYASANYARLTVKDSGCGMTSETMEKIFDPFFTTKDVHQGTGMGLATVRGIVELHGGFINVDSVVDKGSIFELYFPAQQSDQDNRPNQQKSLSSGTERILLVDDEEMLADIGSVMLAEMGYQVTSRSNARDALKLVEENPHLFDLVITDQTMPGLTGKELAERLKNLRPELPIVLCTGYSSQIIGEDPNQHGIDAFCMKPLEMADLSQTIRRCLDKNKR